MRASSIRVPLCSTLLRSSRACFTPKRFRSHERASAIHRTHSSPGASDMRLSDCVRHILCALCFLLAITAGSAFAAGNRGSITGSVVDPLGEAIAGASVSLLHNGDEVSQAATDERGAFLFPDVSSGRYQLHVVAQGFETRTTDAMFVAAGARAAVDVMLVSLRESVTHRAASQIGRAHV